MNRFGINLEQCEPNVGLALTDFGHDPSSSDYLRGIVFQKTQKLLTKFFQALRFQAVITPQ